MGNLKKDGLALRLETKMAHLAQEIGAWSMLKFLIGSLDFRARGQRVITIDSCYNEGT